MVAILFLISLLPAFLQRPLRNFLGAKIHRGAKIRSFAFVLTRNLTMDEKSEIGSLVFLKSDVVSLGCGAKIRSVCIIKVRELVMGKFTSMDSMVMVNCDYETPSFLKMGKWSRIFSFSLIEPSEGVTIGEDVGIGGQSLIFCHGSWPNYLRGAPYSRGPVIIEDRVWLPWRVMVLPNTRIGHDAVIGAHSLVRGSVPAQSLYSGVPGKVIKDNVYQNLTEAEVRSRLAEIVDRFLLLHPEAKEFALSELATDKIQSPKPSMLYYSMEEIKSPISANFIRGSAGVIDFKSAIAHSISKNGIAFINFLETYGIRLELRS